MSVRHDVTDELLNIMRAIREHGSEVTLAGAALRDTESAFAQATREGVREGYIEILWTPETDSTNTFKARLTLEGALWAMGMEREEKA